MNKIYYYFIKTFLCVCLFLILAIICKKDYSYKEYIQKKLYQEYLDFSSIKLMYNKYLGGIFPIDNISTNGVRAVFNEDLMYQDATTYKDGVMLNVDYNYLLPSVNSGIVVYVGEKEDYGDVIIVEGNDGIDVWYGNMCNRMVRLYDIVDTGSYLGEVCDNKVYIVYTRKNKFLNYVDYLK